MNEISQRIFHDLYDRYPRLLSCRDDICRAFDAVTQTFRSGGKLLICGNGGSAADAEHIAGELMKGFLLKRPTPAGFRERMREMFGDEGLKAAAKLQRALPAIALTGHIALSTAFNNDVDPALTFAQQVYGYGKPGDILMGISTSGNSTNVIKALWVAKALGVKTVGLTGKTGGSMASSCDICIKVPAGETYEVQELHLPVYHCLCSMIEAEIYSE